MKKRNKEIPILILIFLAGIMIVFFKVNFTGYVTYPATTQMDWCNGSDINRDGKVNETDQTILNSFWDNKTCSSINYWCNLSDINRDGAVELGDLGLLGNNLGKTDCIGLGRNLIQNPNFEIDPESFNGKTIPFFWNKNNEEQSINYNIVKDLSGKFASIGINNPSTKFIGIITNPIKVKANTSYSLRGLIGCNDCATTEDFKLFLHVRPLANPANNFYYSNDVEKTTGGYIYGMVFNYNLYELNITTKNEDGLYAYIIAAFLQNKTGTGYVGNLEFKEISKATLQPSQPPATLCSQKGYTCGNVNQSKNMTQSCVALKIEWDKNTTLDNSCNTAGTQGCCKPCSYGFNASLGRCYTYNEQKCSVLKGDICTSSEICPNNNWTIASDTNICCKTNCTLKFQTYKPSATLMKAGYKSSSPLKKGDKIEFTISSGEHILEIISLSTSAARIKISSIPIEDIISEGQTRKFELTGDSYYDLKIELDDIKSSGAEMILTTINELITSKEQTTQNTYKKQSTVVYSDETGEEIEQPLTWIYIVVALVVMILFVGILLFIAHKRRTRYDKED